MRLGARSISIRANVAECHGWAVSSFTLQGPEAELVLITSPDYFMSGLDAFLKVHQVLSLDMTIPVRALVRVFAAQAYSDHWIAVPYLMYEHQPT